MLLLSLHTLITQDRQSVARDQWQLHKYRLALARGQRLLPGSNVDAGNLGQLGRREGLQNKAGHIVTGLGPANANPEPPKRVVQPCLARRVQTRINRHPHAAFVKGPV